MSRRDEFNPVAEGIPFDNSTNGFTADNTQAAIEEAKQTAEGFPRATIGSIQNGTVGNNDWLGPNELTPNTPLVVFPVSTKINEITWSNQNDDVRFEIEFRRGSKTGTIFYTLIVNSTNSGFGYVSGLSFVFSPGEAIYAQYKDTGQNCSDFNLLLWFSRNM